jgi:hypothetical protein
MPLKTVRIADKPRRFSGLHIEAPGCIINVWPYLVDADGHDVTTIEVKCDDHAGEPKRYIANDAGHDTKHAVVRVLREREA